MNNKNYIALALVVIVLIGFGIFWYQNKNVSKSETSANGMSTSQTPEEAFQVWSASVSANTMIPDIDDHTFFSFKGTPVVKDTHSVYIPELTYLPVGNPTWKLVPFSDADPQTFEMVYGMTGNSEDALYAKDKSNVWRIVRGEGGFSLVKEDGVNSNDCVSDTLSGCEAN